MGLSYTGVQKKRHSIRKGENGMHKQSRHWVILPLLIIAGIGTILQYRMMREGISLWEDSYDYITAAINLIDLGKYGRIDGFGDFKPLTHFPPLYPFLLAAPYSMSIDILEAARWISSIFFGINLFLIGWTIRLLSGSSVWAIFGALLGCISESLINTHLWALSEPPFFTFSMLTLLALNTFFNKVDSRRWLMIAGVLASLATLTRFAGFALIGACMMALLILPDDQWLRKIRSALIFLSIALLPNIVFMIRNYLQANTFTDDPGIAWHPPTIEQWQDLSRITLNWILPDVIVENLSGAFTLSVLLVCLGILIIVIALGYKRYWMSSFQKNLWNRHFLSLHLIYLLAYSGLFLATVFIWRRITPADNRLISPIYLSTVILVSSIAGVFWKSSGRISRSALLALIVLLMSIQGLRYRNIFRLTPQEAYGLSAPKWRTSETLSYIATFDGGRIYSNEIQAIYFHANRNAIFLPTYENPATGVRRPDYERNLVNMQRNLRTTGGLLVIFYPERLEEQYLEALTENLIIIETFPDGVIYGYLEE